MNANDDYRHDDHDEDDYRYDEDGCRHDEDDRRHDDFAAADAADAVDETDDADEEDVLDLGLAAFYEEMDERSCREFDEAVERDRRRAERARIEDMRAVDRMQRGARRRALPSYDGDIPLAVRDESLHYHVQLCFEHEYTDAYIRNLVMQICRTICAAVEVMRARQTGSSLAKYVRPECIRRIETMRSVLEGNPDQLPAPALRLRYAPVMPRLVHAMMLNEQTLEISIHITLGATPHCGNMRLVRHGSRWVCDMIDLG